MALVKNSLREQRALVGRGKGHKGRRDQKTNWRNDTREKEQIDNGAKGKRAKRQSTDRIKGRKVVGKQGEKGGESLRTIRCLSRGSSHFLEASCGIDRWLLKGASWGNGV